MKIGKIANRQHIRVFVPKLPHVTLAQHEIRFSIRCAVWVCERTVCVRPARRNLRRFKSVEKHSYLHLIRFSFVSWLPPKNPIALLTSGLHIVSDLTPSVAWRSRLLLLLVINLSGNVDSTYINNNQNNVEMCRACTCALIPILIRREIAVLILCSLPLAVLRYVFPLQFNAENSNETS